MNSFIEKLRDGLLSSFEIPAHPHEPVKIKIVKQRKYIRKELLNSKETGTAIGVYCSALGEGMFLTAVDDIIGVENDEVVVLKPLDMNGIILQRNHIGLNEIQSVCPFDSLYSNPLIKKDREFSY
jgi:hypothetical protein